jgi:hypothetical protein
MSGGLTLVRAGLTLAELREPAVGPAARRSRAR